MSRRLNNGADTVGNLTCPRCSLPRQAGHYLCGTCWNALPARTRTSLYRRDRLALTRLKELLEQITEGVPLQEIEVAP
ncbi:MAG: hypothetical protein HOV92_37020 [Streptomyces sp.]|nr:hypothetical protein [Streptomyces sp.]